MKIEEMMPRYREDYVLQGVDFAELSEKWGVEFKRNEQLVNVLMPMCGFLNYLRRVRKKIGNQFDVLMSLVDKSSQAATDRLSDIIYNLMDDSLSVINFLNIVLKEIRSCGLDEDSGKMEYLGKICHDIRQFSSLLYHNDSSYYAPLWSGLARIENDEALISATIRLIDLMWD